MQPLPMQAERRRELSLIDGLAGRLTADDEAFVPLERLQHLRQTKTASSPVKKRRQKTDDKEATTRTETASLHMH